VRWLITGAGGQLGHHLRTRLATGQDEVAALDRAQLDITDPSAIEAAVAAHRPDVLVNAAAYTAVDAAETDAAAARAVNATGPGLLAAALARHGGRLIQVSTDYVFAGDRAPGGAGPDTGAGGYEPGDATGPRTAYGRTKLAGEAAVLAALPGRATVVRTAWVHGGPGANFVATMLRLERERETVDVVADQLGSPTWAGDLAAALLELGRSDVAAPVLHYAGAGQASWHELAQAVFVAAGADPARVRPVASDRFPRPAPRPAWSVLSSAAWTGAGLTAPPPWPDGVAASVAAQRLA
jgi:dTDP-4-dehydrorhamnose reductase